MWWSSSCQSRSCSCYWNRQLEKLQELQCKRNDFMGECNKCNVKIKLSNCHGNTYWMLLRKTETVQRVTGSNVYHVMENIM